MYERLLPEVDRRISPRSVTAGFVLNVGLFLVLVAASYPLATGVVIATGIGLYVLIRAVEWPTYERSLRLSRTEICLCFQLRPR